MSKADERKFKSNKVRGRLKMYGYTQKDAADFLGVDAGSFGNWLKQKQMRSDRIEKLAQLLDIESYDFFFKD